MAAADLGAPHAFHPNTQPGPSTRHASYFELYGRRRGTTSSADQTSQHEGEEGTRRTDHKRTEESARPTKSKGKGKAKDKPIQAITIAPRGSSLENVPHSPRHASSPPSILLRGDSFASTATSSTHPSSPRASLASLSLTTSHDPPGSPAPSFSGRLAQRPWIRARTSSKVDSPVESEIASFKPERHPTISFSPVERGDQSGAGGSAAMTSATAGGSTLTPRAGTTNTQPALTRLIIQPPTVPTPAGLALTPPLTPSPPTTPLGPSPISPRVTGSSPATRSASAANSPADYVSSRRSSAANSLAPSAYTRRAKHVPSKASLRGGDPSVASRAGSDSDSGDEGLIASVSTDMMDSFIDGMNAQSKPKRRSKSSRRSSADVALQQSVRSNSSSVSPVATRSRKRSTIASPLSPSRPAFGTAAASPPVSPGGNAAPPTPPAKTGVYAFPTPMTPPAQPSTKQTNSSLSIDEIIRRNKAMAPHAFAPAPSRRSPSRSDSKSSPPAAYPSGQPVESVDMQRKASVASSGVDVEIARSMQLLAQLEKGDADRKEVPAGRRRPSVLSRSQSATASSAAASNPRAPSAASQRTAQDDIAEYLQSPRFTRLIAIRKPQVLNQVVSLADVGDPDGYPVVVFLGLGSVRYLVALFDEVAAAHGVRLICIDRPGLGRSTAVPGEKRGVAEWAQAVEDVLDQVHIRRFAILAHSAGVPYALACALHMPRRVAGRIHLLAPWVNRDINGAYNWLRYVPSAVIKTAQATEWKIQGWRLGKPPKRVSQGIAYDARAPVLNDPSRSKSRDGQPCRMDSDEFEVLKVSLDMPVATDGQSHHRSASASTTDLSATSHHGTASEQSIDLPAPRAKRISLLGRPKTRSPTPSSTDSTATRAEAPLAVALLQASHAEALSGGTADLLTIMGKDARGWGYEYTDVRHPCVIWWGERDDKVSERSVRWMEAAMPDARLKVLAGEGHNLMTSSGVMLDVLDSLAEDARREAW